jgi:hypothetical protein
MQSLGCFGNNHRNMFVPLKVILDNQSKNLVGSSGLLRKKQICISLHFFAFNFIRLLDAHVAIEVKSDWITDGSPINKVLTT